MVFDYTLAFDLIPDEIIRGSSFPASLPDEFRRVEPKHYSHQRQIVLDGLHEKL